MTTITLRAVADINWHNVQAIAYDHADVILDPGSLAAVHDGRERFVRAIEAGLPCYGVSTGLGKFVERNVADSDDPAFVANILRARAVAIGPPLPRAVSRGALVLKLTNFLSGMDGVRPALCEYMVARLNDGLTPWIPSYGHGMAADATANGHVFQTLAGEGFVWSGDGTHGSAHDALRRYGADPYIPDRKEALALINGIAVPAYALDAHRRLSTLLATANCVAASSIVAAALPMDSIDAAVGDVSAARGVADVIKHLQHVVSAHDRRPHKLQAPVSFRIVPQVHGACSDALHDLRQRIEECFCSFSDNPMLVENHQGERKFLSVGVFHNQHLVNQIDHVALAIAHIAALSERRLHRLLDADVTGLSPQLAIRPGLDVGLVVAHKAALESIARIKFLAQPVSLHTGESSGGQEDYMSMAIPAIARLYEMLQSIRQILAAELLAILVALDQRAPPTASHTAAVHTCARRYVQKMTGDRATGADTEALLKLFDSEEWQALSSCDMSASVLSD